MEICKWRLQAFKVYWYCWKKLSKIYLYNLWQGRLATRYYTYGVVLIMNTKDKINKINALCSTIISLSNLYNNDDEKECCIDYDNIIAELENIVTYSFKKELQ